MSVGLLSQHRLSNFPPIPSHSVHGSTVFFSLSRASPRASRLAQQSSSQLVAAVGVLLQAVPSEAGPSAEPFWQVL
jgi:hypothetical protein